LKSPGKFIEAIMNPYLSIVLTGRNDNYGGDFIKRLQDFFDWNCNLLEKHKIETEILFINWNPIENNSSILELIQFPTRSEYIHIRIITVSSEFHKAFVNPDIRRTVPIFEFIAKNAGIRRAKGNYILSLNADILIHPKIIENIAKKKLTSATFCRANRLDFKPCTKINSTNQLFENAIYVSLKGFKYSFKKVAPIKFQYLILYFINAIRLYWELLKRNNEKLSKLFGFSITFDNAEYYAHCLNSGDFMLMHRDNWFKLKSYPENTFVSTHTDALFTVFAYSQLKEFIFKDPIFHQEHERRYSSKIIKEDDELVKAYKNFQSISQDILKDKNPEKYFNADDWGLKAFELTEITIQ
jgi:hypothetical protein